MSLDKGSVPERKRKWACATLLIDADPFVLV